MQAMTKDPVAVVRAAQKHAPAKPTLPADTVRGNARSKFAQCLEQALKELKETGADAAELKNPAETAAAIESECQKLYGKSPLGGGWLLSPPSPDPLSTLTCYCSCSVTRAPCKLSLRLRFPTSPCRPAVSARDQGVHGVVGGCCVLPRAIATVARRGRCWGSFIGLVVCGLKCTAGDALI